MTLNTCDSFDEYVNVVDSLYGPIAFFHNDLYLGKSLSEYGEWARSEIELLTSFLVPGSVVVDAGAFIGTHTMAFSKAVGETGKVYAFEPHPWYYRLLTRNVSTNRLANVCANNYGLSECAAVMEVITPDLASDSSLGSIRLQDHITATNVDRVEVRALDDIGLDSCDLIKADVEGMEARLLVGASQTIKRCKPIIYTECNSADDAWPVVLFMRGLGYKIFLFATKAFNANNYRQNSYNIFGEAMELGIVSVPPHRLTEFDAISSRHVSIVSINTLDDLVLCLLKKPQYKQEILSQTSGTKLWGMNFWLNETELCRIATEQGEVQKRMIAALTELAAICETERASLATELEKMHVVAYASERETRAIEQAEALGRIAAINHELLAYKAHWIFNILKYPFMGGQ